MRRTRRLTGVCALGLALCLFAAALSGSAAAQDPTQRHLELKQLMLELINEARREAGAPAVRLGTNAAAQLHAEQMVDACFHSHWGRDGLKPYMRYSLLGGYQSNAENVRGASRFFGVDPCAVAASTEPPDLEWLVRDAMEAWLLSPGHRQTLLDPTQRLVNVGIAWRGGRTNRDGEAYIFRAVQHFEGDYVRLDRLPALVGGQLTLSGRTVNGASPGTYLIIYHDPQPQPQSSAALDAVGSYCGGYPVAAVFPSANWSVSSPTPNCVEPGAAAPRGDGELIKLPTIAAAEWRVDGAEFEIRADLSSALQLGAGVYTVALTGEVDGARTRLLEYVLFYGLWPLNRAWVYSSGPLSASTLFEQLELEAVFRWDGAAWRGYAASDAGPIPGAADFTAEAGDWLWLAAAR